MRVLRLILWLCLSAALMPWGAYASAPRLLPVAAIEDTQPVLQPKMHHCRAPMLPGAPCTPAPPVPAAVTLPPHDPDAVRAARFDPARRHAQTRPRSPTDPPRGG